LSSQPKKTCGNAARILAALAADHMSPCLAHCLLEEMVMATTEAIVMKSDTRVEGDALLTSARVIAGISPIHLQGDLEWT
jgi:hypothetical protein